MSGWEDRVANIHRSGTPVSAQGSSGQFADIFTALNNSFSQDGSGVVVVRSHSAVGTPVLPTVTSFMPAQQAPMPVMGSPFAYPPPNHTLVPQSLRHSVIRHDGGNQGGFAPPPHHHQQQQQQQQQHPMPNGGHMGMMMMPGMPGHGHGGFGGGGSASGNGGGADKYSTLERRLTALEGAITLISAESGAAMRELYRLKEADSSFSEAAEADILDRTRDGQLAVLDQAVLIKELENQLSLRDKELLEERDRVGRLEGQVQLLQESILLLQARLQVGRRGHKRGTGPGAAAPTVVTATTGNTPPPSGRSSTATAPTDTSIDDIINQSQNDLMIYDQMQKVLDCAVEQNNKLEIRVDDLVRELVLARKRIGELEAEHAQQHQDPQRPPQS